MLVMSLSFQGIKLTGFFYFLPIIFMTVPQMTIFCGDLFCNKNKLKINRPCFRDFPSIFDLNIHHGQRIINSALHLYV